MESHIVQSTAWRRCLGALALAAAALAGNAAAAIVTKEDVQPEIASGYSERTLAVAQKYMVSTANPLATEAGLDVLAAGGSATDAVIAAQLVLSLVEPQSSGIGGGAFAISFDASEDRLRAWDGRETAPAAATSGQFTQDGKPMPFRDAVNSGRSVGTPGLFSVMWLMHAQEGRLPWARLFQAAITLAENGFAVTPRLHTLIQENQALRDQAAAAAYFYDGHGNGWPVGHVLRNPELARVLKAVAQKGPSAFYQGDLAQDIVRAVRAHTTPGALSLSDLQGYRAKEREALCSPYKAYELCGMPPPSSGPLAVMQMLGILSHTPVASLPPNSLQSVHLFSEAGKLAFADRDFYLADPDFQQVPVKGLLDPGYLKARASMISAETSFGRAPPGDPSGMLSQRGHDDSPELASTTHIVAVDEARNVVSMTSSVESAFGSKIFVGGFLLNNQLTDFSLSPTDSAGRVVANRLEPHKRPRSSMAPMLVMRDGKPILAIGSPGGASIINYVAKALLGVLDWGLDIQQAINLPNRGSRNSFTELEKGTSLGVMAPVLRKMGHDVREVDFTSGLQGVMITDVGLEGGADPRREGLAAGR